MTTEPTSALTYEDLIIEVALLLSVAYYGAAGDEAPQVPTDAHDLAECKRYVNNGIRMFLADAPPNGWRWTRPTASVTLWPSVPVDSTVTATGTYAAGTGLTTITASAEVFYPTMEAKAITVTDVGDITIASYTSATVVTATGDHSWIGSKTFAVTADGNYTLTRVFGGQYTGPITYAADTNTGATVEWSSEAVIRTYREPSVVESGYPFKAAVRRMADTPRRWELMVYPIPQEVLVVEFPFDLHFDSLVNLTDLHPAGFAFDEAVKTACRAVAEKEAEEAPGVEWSYYREIALPNAWRTDARSAPRKLGYCGNGQPTMSQDDFRRYIQRPIVTYNQ